MPDAITFTPASQVTERHALVVALEAPPNAGKTFSGCRLAKGMADAQGKRFAVADTEGGRTLHLRNQFDFDVTMIGPPHTPETYLKAAQAAQAAGYGALLIDSFSNVWRGIGGVLQWTDEELEGMVERERQNCEQYRRAFNESAFRDKAKPRAFIRPKQAFKFMMAGLLDIRMPVILSIRGELTFDFTAKKEVFKAHMNKGIGFDVTCRFRLMPDRKGIIDVSDSEKFKMEGDHATIFRNGEQLNERHGAALEAWARNAAFDPQQQQQPAGQAASADSGDKTRRTVDDLIAKIKTCADSEGVDAILADEKVRTAVVWMLEKRPEEHTRLFDAANAKRRALRDALQADAGGPL
jgi:hypothetical protein